MRMCERWLCAKQPPNMHLLSCSRLCFIVDITHTHQFQLPYVCVGRNRIFNINSTLVLLLYSAEYTINVCVCRTEWRRYTSTTKQHSPAQTRMFGCVCVCVFGLRRSAWLWLYGNVVLWLSISSTSHVCRCRPGDGVDVCCVCFTYVCIAHSMDLFIKMLGVVCEQLRCDVCTVANLQYVQFVRHNANLYKHISISVNTQT